ncbi:TetR/AcrR family transcriptional regulator [Mycobacterium sp. OTB74]|uniref:TetR/AcrR family transcriptional regulator n=1 Tax=Mycobacterium sp. OTB74 TaxID=1853452 RepID=UPI00247600AF|nr:TetR/AcrR family transcriptional regulator [Mycobacterium sp. OTB74]
MLKAKPPERGRKGLQTRERLFGAAVAEFKRQGMAGADTTAIASAAGVAHGTFFFHFPTKEHVLLEVERREEERMTAELTRFFGKPHDVRGTLTETVRIMEKLERRQGPRLFKEVLVLHFSTTRPTSDEWSTHPVIVAVIDELGRAQARGEIPADVDVIHNGVSFLVGLYAMLISLPTDKEFRTRALDEYLTTYMYGLRALPK